MRQTLLALVLACSLALSAPAADAAQFSVGDPVGDDPTNGPVLDITRLRVNNRDHQLVVKVSFVRAGRGDLIIVVHERGETTAEGVGIISHHRPRRGDINEVGTQDGVQACRGLRVLWDHEQDIATVRLPSRCHDGGDYGAVRVRVLTELVIDQDFAPQGPPLPDADQPTWRWTPWVARG